MATFSSILAWEFPWTEEPGRLQSMGCKDPDTTQQLNNNKYNTHTHTPHFQFFSNIKAEKLQLRLNDEKILNDQGYEECRKNSESASCCDLKPAPERSKYRHITKEEKAVVCWWNRLKAGLTVLAPSSSSLPKQSPTRASREFCSPERPCLTAKDAQSDSQIFSAASSFPPKSYRKHGAQ